MKKILPGILALSLLFTGCGIENPYKNNIQPAAENYNRNVVNLSAERTLNNYTVADITALSSFLAHISSVSDGKDYDLNNDGKWDVFDLILMKREVLNSMETNSEPIVYMTEKIDPDSLMRIYEALEANPTGKVAVKISTGESEKSNHLDPNLIKDLVHKVNGTIVECNTAYGGNRSSTAKHKQLAKDHGYTDIADVDIMDEDGSLSLPVEVGDNLKENLVGSHFKNYDYFVVLSHFKGHAMAGFGGAIKNISIGIASSKGKANIHSGGTGGSMWGGDQDAFLESMAEAGKTVVDALNGNILYINVMNRLSVDCDCDGNPSEPEMHDIGILASYDPVALDQACVDLVYAAKDGASLIKRMESRHGIHTLEQAEKIGLGSREYKLVNID